MHYNLDNFRDALNQCGIAKGDVVNVSSDVSEILLSARKHLGLKSKSEYVIYLEDMIEILKNQISREGTLLFPVYNTDFCHGTAFDYRNTPGVTGALANQVLFSHPEFLRTKSPTHSFMVWGKDARLLYETDNQESTGPDSPYHYMHTHNGKLLLINTPLKRGFTFMHYVEQSVDVPYRYHKYFLGRYIDGNGIETVKCYSVFVRDLEIEMDVTMPDTFLDLPDVMLTAKSDFYHIRAVDLPKAFKMVEHDLKYNNGENCYKFKNYTIDWSVGKTHSHEICDWIAQQEEAPTR